MSRLLITSDYHIMEDTPICRTDNIQETQFKKIQFICDLSDRYRCPVIHAGDLFNRAKPSLELVNKLLTLKFAFRDRFFTVAGNHDLPQHSLKLIHKSAVCTLTNAGKIQLLSTCNWNEEPKKPSLIIEDKKILVWHVMCYQGKSANWNEGGFSAKSILKKYPNFDLIVTGDNHQSFMEEYNGRLLINPGSLMRISADQMNHQPYVYLYDTDRNSATKIKIPIEKKAISREHIEIQEKRNDRIEAFILKTQEKLNSKTSECSFEDNLNIFIENNKTELNNRIIEILNESIDN